MSDREELFDIIERGIIDGEGPIETVNAILESDWLDRKLNDAYSAGYDMGWTDAHHGYSPSIWATDEGWATSEA